MTKLGYFCRRKRISIGRLRKENDPEEFLLVFLIGRTLMRMFDSYDCNLSEIQKATNEFNSSHT